MSLFTASRLLVLLAVIYAVWDKLSEQLARQRFVDAELRAAQEIQEVLVPATEALPRAKVDPHKNSSP